MKVNKAAAILSLLLGASACSQPNDWTLFVYPSGQGGFALITPGFSRDMCALAGREAVHSHSSAPDRQALIARGESGAPSFECGRRCRIGEIKTVATCAETFDEGD